MAVCPGVACSGGKSKAHTAATVPRLQLGPGQIDHQLDETFQYAGFSVNIGHAVWDQPSRTMLLGVRFINLGDRWNSPDLTASVDVAGQHVPLIAERPQDVPPRLSADFTLAAEGLTADPAPTGVLTWGKDGTSQPHLPLGPGAPQNAFNPATVSLDGWASIGKYSVHVTGGKVLAGDLDLNAQAPAGKRILRLLFDQWADRLDPVNGFYPVEHLTLTLPDGTTVPGLDSTPGFAPMSWTTKAGNWIEFPVPDPPTGDYRLLLSSLSPKGFSTLRPDLIDRVGMPLHVGALSPLPVARGLSPVPVLPPTQRTVLPAAPAPATPPGIDEKLAVGAVNVGGFSFAPDRLHWDPAAKIATLDGAATYLETESNPLGGLLSSPPAFSFTEDLASKGQLYTGITEGNTSVDPTRPTPISLRFLNVDDLDPSTATLMIGPRGGAVSTLPLSSDSSVVAYPPAPQFGLISAPPVTAGDWTVTLTAFRVGFLRSDNPPPPGLLDLEVTMRVTVSASATVPALGLSFRPSVQLFRWSDDGYLIQPVSDSGLVQYKPGETHIQSVTYHAPDSVGPGRYGFVLRSNDEVADITITKYVETTFAADLVNAAISGQLP
jgi:hypothetical protein